MLIDTKYELGQEIYFVRGFYEIQRVESTCPNCKGKYEKNMKGGRWYCNICEQGKIKETKDILSIILEEEPYTVNGFWISVDSEGKIEGIRVAVIQKRKDNATSYFHFHVNLDDKKNDDWAWMEKDDGIEQGIEYKKVHLTKKPYKLNTGG